jgi:hypothetical protein
MFPRLLDVVPCKIFVLVVAVSMKAAADALLAKPHRESETLHAFL